MSINGGMDKEDVVHICNGLLVIKRNGTGPFAETWGRDSYCSWIPFAIGAHSHNLLLREGCLRSMETKRLSSQAACLVSPWQMSWAQRFSMWKWILSLVCWFPEWVGISHPSIHHPACLVLFPEFLFDPGEEWTHLGSLLCPDGRSIIRGCVAFLYYVECWVE